MTFSVRMLSERCLIPTRPAALYRSIHRLLYGEGVALPHGGGPIKVRLLAGAHPYVEVHVTANDRMPSERVLMLARHCDGTLENGFVEYDVPGELCGA